MVWIKLAGFLFFIVWNFIQMCNEGRGAQKNLGLSRRQLFEILSSFRCPQIKIKININLRPFQLFQQSVIRRASFAHKELSLVKFWGKSERNLFEGEKTSRYTPCCFLKNLPKKFVFFKIAWKLGFSRLP